METILINTNTTRFSEMSAISKAALASRGYQDYSNTAGQADFAKNLPNGIQAQTTVFRGNDNKAYAYQRVVDQFGNKRLENTTPVTPDSPRIKAQLLVDQFPLTSHI